MARFEKDFSEEGQEPISLNELLSLLGGDTGEGPSRQDAIACYLSGSDGWRDAVKMLGGAFAAGATGLKGRKND
ncbi:MAG: hypothetical protein V4513_03075 [Pseudomonadota bacterium]